MKRLLAIVIAIAMLASFLPANVIAQEPETAEGITYKITIEGGTGSFENKSAAFNGVAEENDIIQVTLTPKEGRQFLYWESADGLKIADESFRLLVTKDAYLFPVFSDRDENEFGDWEIVSKGNCTEGTLYKRQNAKGDVEYRLETDYHDFNLYENVDDETHLVKCQKCGYSYVEEHYFSNENVIKQATHDEEGKAEYKCYDCGAIVTKIIPKTDVHEFGDWIIIKKSENGQYGIRERQCKYCDYREDYWYLDADLTGFYDNAYIKVNTSSFSATTHNESHYYFTRDDGKKVYVMEMQYRYTFGSSVDQNETFIFMFIDDGKPDVLKPVYLSKTTGDRIPEYLWAKYAYIHDFDEWMYLINRPDDPGSTIGGMVIGNTMSARSVQLPDYINSWAEEYNKHMIPISDDPNSFITPDGTEYGWKINQVTEKEISYRRLQSTNGDSEYYFVDRSTGMTLGYFDNVARYSVFIERRPIVTAEEYLAKPVDERSKLMRLEDIEKEIKSVCSNRNPFFDFTLELPEETEGVRILISNDLGEISGTYANLYNTARLYPIFENSYDTGITVTWAPWSTENANLKVVFDRWEIWDFEKWDWVPYSNDDTILVNGPDNRVDDVTYIRAVTHIEDVTEYGHIKIVDGYFHIVGDDSWTYYDECDVPVGAKISVSAYGKEGYMFDALLDENGQPVTGIYNLAVTGDATYTVSYVKEQYYVCAYALDLNGQIKLEGEDGTDWVAGVIETYAYNGDVLTFTTRKDENNPSYDTFLGWYFGYYDKRSGGLTYRLITKELTLNIEVTGYMDEIYAIWTDGTFSPDSSNEKLINVTVVNGFASCSDMEVGYGDGLFVDKFSYDGYAGILLVDNPNDSLNVTEWHIVWYPDGDSTQDNYSDYTHWYLSNYYEWSEEFDGKVTITGNGVSLCETHDWELTYTYEPTYDEPGYKEYTCKNCGEVYYEDLPQLVKPVTTDWVSDGPDTHSRLNEDVKETKPHQWTENTVLSPAGAPVTEFTCELCGEKKTENVYVLITWIVDGYLYTSYCKKGEIPAFSGDTSKADDYFSKYTFKGWDKPLAPVTEETTYTAVYDITPIYSCYISFGQQYSSAFFYGTVATVYTGEYPPVEGINVQLKLVNWSTEAEVAQYEGVTDEFGNVVFKVKFDDPDMEEGKYRFYAIFDNENIDSSFCFIDFQYVKDVTDVLYELNANKFYGNAKSNNAYVNSVDLQEAGESGTDYKLTVSNDGSMYSGTVKSVTVSGEAVKSISEAVSGASTFTVETPVASMTFSAGSFGAVAQEAGESAVSFSITGSSIENLPPQQALAAYTQKAFAITDFTVESEGKEITTFAGSTITINIPNPLSEESEDVLERIQIVCIAEDGSVEALETKYENGVFSAETTHLSLYALVDPQTIVYGDTTGDGEITAADLTALARHVAKIEYLTGDALAAADVDCDGDVDASDLTMLARYVAKIIDKLGK